MEGVSIDGKTLRGSKKQGAENSHLLSAVRHGLGLVLGQIAVDDKTNEIGVVEDLLMQLALKGRIVTTDALLTQKFVAQTIVDNQGDYVLPVKGNQDLTYHGREDWFGAQPPPHLANGTAYHVEKGHGRLTRWEIEVTSFLNDYLDWPGLAQCFKLERRNVDLSTGEVTAETHYGVTSLTPQKASPANLLFIKRNHWCIENRSHWVRDVTFDEDRSQVRVGHTHQLRAALRNLAITLLRLAGFPNIASAVRYFAAQPCSALPLVFQPLVCGE